MQYLRTSTSKQSALGAARRSLKTQEQDVVNRANNKRHRGTEILRTRSYRHREATRLKTQEPKHQSP